MVDLVNSRAFEAVVDSLETGVYLVDRYRKIVYWNHGAERISGYKHDVTGRFCRDDLLVHCDEHERQLCGSSCLCSIACAMGSRGKRRFTWGTVRDIAFLSTCARSLARPEWSDCRCGGDF